MADLLRVPAVNVGWHAPRHAIHEKSALSGIETVPRCGLTKAKQRCANPMRRVTVKTLEHVRWLYSRAPQATVPGTVHYHVPFLAQLVATKDGHPQTRERRRAEPNVALAAYRTHFNSRVRNRPCAAPSHRSARRDPNQS